MTVNFPKTRLRLSLVVFGFVGPSCIGPTKPNIGSFHKYFVIIYILSTLVL